MSTQETVSIMMLDLVKIDALTSNVAAVPLQGMVADLFRLNLALAMAGPVETA